MSNILQNVIIQYLQRRGLRMHKEVGSGGLFFNPTYDRRTVYTLERMGDLAEEGFSVEPDDVAMFLFNALLQYENNDETCGTTT